MVEDEGGQKNIISLFQTISSEKRMQIVERELAQMKENNNDATSCNVQKEKHLVGRPRIQHNVRTLSDHEVKKEDHENKKPFKRMKKQGAYHN
jgi:uncharacterized membrane-anchored protein YjiN (DUF445 family)